MSHILTPDLCSGGSLPLWDALPKNGAPKFKSSVKQEVPVEHPIYHIRGCDHKSTITSSQTAESQAKLKRAHPSTSPRRRKLSAESVCCWQRPPISFLVSRILTDCTNSFSFIPAFLGQRIPHHHTDSKIYADLPWAPHPPPVKVQDLERKARESQWTFFHCSRHLGNPESATWNARPCWRELEKSRRMERLASFRSFDLNTSCCSRSMSDVWSEILA